MKWVVVLSVALLIVLFASMGRLPFTERQLATSDETRATAEAQNTPRYTRQQAISFVEEDIRENCNSADKYLPHLDRMEATWIRQPWADDHYIRGDREWTVTDPLSRAMWRLYEDTGEIVAVLGDC